MQRQIRLVTQNRSVAVLCRPVAQLLITAFVIIVLTFLADKPCFGVDKVNAVLMKKKHSTSKPVLLPTTMVDVKY